MKKVITTLTAIAFALSLAGPGMAQTATKEGEKPAVKIETPGAPHPAPKDVKPVKKEEPKPGVEKGKTEVKPVEPKKDDKTKKDKKSKKDEKKPVTSPDKPKEEKK